MERRTLAIRKLTPSEKIPMLGGATVGDFWAWAYSDVLSNTNRAVFAEFLVGLALGVTSVPRVEWDAVDLRYRGKNVEVKSSAYVQSWKQEKPSQIVFDIKERLSWYAESNTYASEAGRAADCYVFCLYTETDRAKAHVEDVSKWQFYVLSTAQINRDLGHQKSVSLGRIQTISEAVDHSGLKDRIDSELGLGT